MTTYNVDWSSAVIDALGNATYPQQIPGKGTISIQPKASDDTTSLVLTGKGFPDYGQTQQTNFTHLLENFASSSAPITPTVGQLWFNPATNTLSIYSNSQQWVKVNSSNASDVTSALGFTPVNPGNVAVSSVSSASGLTVATNPSTGGLIFTLSPVSATANGYLTSQDWIAFTNKISGLSVTSPLTNSGGSNPSLGITQASSSSNGYLAASDWAIFNNKQGSLGYTPVNKSGDTMGGYLSLVGPPTAALHAATKAYADSLTMAGPTGAVGPQGPQGVQGPIGLTGPQGSTGASGAAATIAVGSVASLPAGSTPTIVNAGTSSAAVFNFAIPAGATGPQGLQGPVFGANLVILSSATTTSANFTVPAGVSLLRVTVMGAGGGGAGWGHTRSGTVGAGTVSGSGGNGGFCQAYIPVTPGQVYTCFIPGKTPKGTSGGVASFAGLIMCTGGAAGSGAVSGADGAVALGGQYTVVRRGTCNGSDGYSGYPGSPGTPSLVDVSPGGGGGGAGFGGGGGGGGGASAISCDTCYGYGGSGGGGGAGGAGGIPWGAGAGTAGSATGQGGVGGIGIAGAAVNIIGGNGGAGGSSFYGAGSGMQGYGGDGGDAGEEASQVGGGSSATQGGGGGGGAGGIIIEY